MRRIRRAPPSGAASSARPLRASGMNAPTKGAARVDPEAGFGVGHGFGLGLGFGWGFGCGCGCGCGCGYGYGCGFGFGFGFGFGSVIVNEPPGDVHVTSAPT